MVSAREFQEGLHRLATNIGTAALKRYYESYERYWRDEESTTASLLSAMVEIADHQDQQTELGGVEGFVLRAEIATKREESRHGADVLIRFKCEESQWKINTGTLLQAKRLNKSESFSGADHRRLIRQLEKMIEFTPESFVMLYAQKEGVRFVPALAASALGSRKLFDLPTTSFPRFLSNVMRGRVGEPSASRLPPGGDGPPGDDKEGTTSVVEINVVVTRATERSLAAHA